MAAALSSHERVLAALRHEQPDRPPVELIATDEVVASLCRSAGRHTPEELLRFLGIDFRKVSLGIRKAQPVPEEVQRAFGPLAGTDSTAGTMRLQATPYGVVLCATSVFPRTTGSTGLSTRATTWTSSTGPSLPTLSPPETVAAAADRRGGVRPG